MKKTLALIIILTSTMGLFSFLRIKSEENKVFQSQQQDLSRPEFTDQFMKLNEEAYKYLIEQQKLMEEKYQIGKYEKWFYDQESGYLTFSDGDVEKIKIKYEEVGTISKTSKTWLWSWANPNLKEKIKTEILEVKKYGEKNNFEPLTKKKWNANEYDGWEMTGISAYLMKAKGAYRVPTDNTYSFMIYKEIIDLREK